MEHKNSKSMKALVSILFTCYFFSYIWAYNDEGVLDIAAFNVQVFGLTKMKNYFVREYLKKIILRYDLILIQEIRDSSEEVIFELLSDIQNSEKNYDIQVSPRLGRTNSKEQYAYIYRTDWLSPVDSFTFNDADDVFEREPYVVRFTSQRANVKDFAVVGIHTAPKDAENEISNLTNVYNDIKSKWGITDVIIMGDFNAGCSYTKDWKNIKLATDSRFYWLIDNTEDTTTKGTDCPYDRIVVAGDQLLKSVLPLSVGTFRYDKEYGLPIDQVLDVSDHFPVYFAIKSKIEDEIISSTIAVHINDLHVNNVLRSYDVLQLRRSALRLSQYKVFSSYTKSGAYLKVTIWKTAPSFVDTLISLDVDFHNDFADFISLNEMYTARRELQKINPLRYLPRGYGLYQTLYNYYQNKRTEYAIKLECSLADRTKPICYLEIKRILSL